MTPQTSEAVTIVARQLGCDEDEAFRRLQHRELVAVQGAQLLRLVVDGIVPSFRWVESE